MGISKIFQSINRLHLRLGLFENIVLKISTFDYIKFKNSLNKF
jgi:hypothetical protein